MILDGRQLVGGERPGAVMDCVAFEFPAGRPRVHGRRTSVQDQIEPTSPAQTGPELQRFRAGALYAQHSGSIWDAGGHFSQPQRIAHEDVAALVGATCGNVV